MNALLRLTVLAALPLLVACADAPVAPAEAPPTAYRMAPRIDGRCVQLRIHAQGPTEIANNCAVPVQVVLCWWPKGGTACTLSRLSSIVPARETGKVEGPGADETALPMFFVCDMSDPKTVCDTTIGGTGT